MRRHAGVSHKEHPHSASFLRPGLIPLPVCLERWTPHSSFAPHGSAPTSRKVSSPPEPGPPSRQSPAMRRARHRRRSPRSTGCWPLWALVSSSSSPMRHGISTSARPAWQSSRAHRDQIMRAAHRHHASNVMIFGSVARGDDNPGSDVDFLVDLDVHRYGLFPIDDLRLELEKPAPRACRRRHHARCSLTMSPSARSQRPCPCEPFWMRTAARDILASDHRGSRRRAPAGSLRSRS